MKRLVLVAFQQQTINKFTYSGSEHFQISIKISLKFQKTIKIKLNTDYNNNITLPIEIDQVSLVDFRNSCSDVLAVRFHFYKLLS